MNNNAYVFDIDDTLVTTKAKVIIRDQDGKIIQELTPAQFNFYKKNENEMLDVSQFDCTKVFNETAQPTKYMEVIEKISVAITEKRTDSKLYILTARGKKIKNTIHEYLKTQNIHVEISNIHTIGDNETKNISELKREVLQNIKNDHTGLVTFFDDNEDNIRLANQIEKVQGRLVTV